MSESEYSLRLDTEKCMMKVIITVMRADNLKTIELQHTRNVYNKKILKTDNITPFSLHKSNSPSGDVEIILNFDPVSWQRRVSALNCQAQKRRTDFGENRF